MPSQSQRDVLSRIHATVERAADVIDRLVGEGCLVRGSRTDLARSGIAVAVRSGSARPDIATEEDVKRAVQNAGRLSYSTGPSGAYLEQLFQGWGILEQIRGRIVVPPPGVPVGSLVADGSVALGFQQFCELKDVPGVEVLGPLPSSIQSVTTFSGGIGTACREPGAAGALLEFMASAEVADLKRRHGMEPVTP